MIQSARANANSVLPILIKNATNNKELFWDYVLKTVTEACVFPKTDGPGYITLIIQLTVTLYFIDGHARTIEGNLLEKFLRFS